MSIASEIERLNNAKAAIKVSIENKGVEVADDAKLDSFPALIDNIETSGSFIPVEDVVYKARLESGIFQYLFYNCTKTVELDLSGWDLSNATSCTAMFSNCNALNHVILNSTNFVTIDKILELLPAHADAPENDYIVDISGNDSEILKDVSCRYDNYYNGWTIKGAYVVDSSQIVYTSSGDTPATFTSTGLGTYTTSDVDNGDGTITTTIDFTNSPKQIKFSGNILSLDFMENIVLSNTQGMFQGCESLAEINLSNCNMSYVTSIGNMFYNCTALEEININWDGFKASAVTRPFYNCASLTELDLSDWIITENTPFTDKFSGCESLVKLDLSTWDILKSNYKANSVRVFESCNSLAELRLDNWTKEAISIALSSNWQLPTNAIEGKTRTIYCKESEASGLTPPENWVFSYV